jgi:hypothetical protein
VQRQASKQHQGEMMEYKTKVVALRFTPTEHRAMSRFIGKVVDEVINQNGLEEIKPKNIGELIHWMIGNRMEEMLEFDEKELKKEVARQKRLAKKEAASGL